MPSEEGKLIQFSNSMRLLVALQTKRLIPSILQWNVFRKAEKKQDDIVRFLQKNLLREKQRKIEQVVREKLLNIELCNKKALS